MNYECTNIIARLKEHVANQPGKDAYIFIKSSNGSDEAITFSQLEHRVRQIGKKILQTNTENNRVLIMYPPGMEYTTIFLACLYVNYIAIPCYPLSSTSKRDRVINIIEDAEPGIIFCKRQIADVNDQLGNYDFIKWMNLDDLSEYTELSESIIIDPDSIAFLQYTSGSTSAPKGVMVTHKSLYHNLELIKRGFGLTQESRILLWLPPFHDMGLIGGILTGLYVGYTVLLMQPVDFIKKPSAWLQAISDYKATASGGPNFGYDLCVQRVTEEQKKTIDLSRWKIAFCGAEPIREQTLQSFYEAFKECGFSNKAYFPCYGLAEATLFVSGGTDLPESGSTMFEQDQLVQGMALSVEAKTDKVVLLVSSGKMLKEQQVRIVNPETMCLCQMNEIGEIWVKGESVAKGYWNNIEETEETFHAYIREIHEGPYLRTGDLGFLYKEELFIAGRKKDLIIIRGKNYYPNDMEGIIENCHPCFERNGTVAFSIEKDNQEQLVIVQEINRKYLRKEIDFQEIMKIVTEEVNKQYELHIYDFVIVAPKEVSKTSSGKVRRQDTKQKYLRNELKIVQSSKILNKIEKNQENISSHYLFEMLKQEDDKTNRAIMIQTYLIQKLQEKMTGQLTGDFLSQSLASAGLDSIKTIELMHDIERDIQVEITQDELLAEKNLRDISKLIAEKFDFQPTVKKMENYEKIEISKKYPLSHGQKALWFLYQCNANDKSYNVSSVMKLNFQVNDEILDLSFLTLQEQYPILNTRFLQEEDEIHQSLNEEKYKIQRIDITFWESEKVADFIEENVNSSFSLDREQLIRVCHLKHRTGKDILIWVMHHSITDFWSSKVLLEKFAENYVAINGKETVGSVTVPNYYEFIKEQEEYLQSNRGKEDLDFWVKYLMNSPMSSNFPLDYPRKQTQSGHGEGLSFYIEQDMVEKLTNFSRSQGVTLFTLVLSAFYIALHGYSNEDDLVIGVPLSGRSKEKYSKTVGYITNTLPVRIKMQQECSVDSFLSQVYEVLMQVFAHENVPFSRIVKELDIQRDPACSPIYQILFVYQDSTKGKNQDFAAFNLGIDGYQIRFNSLEFETVQYRQEGAQFDFSLIATVTTKGLELILRYNTDILSEDTMKRFIGSYQNLLFSLPEHSKQKIGELSLMPDNEFQKIIYDWNNTEYPLEMDEMIHQMFERATEKNQNKTAVICNNGNLTYKVLNEKADILANYLRLKKVGSNVRVMIYMERCEELIIGIIGILKAGGVYIPVDFSFPQERIGFILEDAECSFVLTKEKYVDQFINKSEINVIILDAKWNEISSSSRCYYEDKITMEDLCYIIYTSGTTGSPKGVMIRHQGLANLICAVSKQIDYQTDYRMISLSSVSFDIFVIDTLIPLIKGMTIVLTTDEENRDPLEISRLIEKYEINIAQTTPSKYKLILAGAGSDFLKGMSCIIAAGEPFGYDLLEKFSKYPNLKIFNGYGPTETTVYSTMCQLHQDEKIVIGKPIDNTYIYILNKYLHPLPVGVVGDLYISGKGVGAGYLNREELTVQKFKSDIFRQGEIMYDTGDLARWMPDGTIDYIGRRDNQVKLRGFRIEIEEIEKNILKYGQFDDVCVLMKGEYEEMYLAAYFVLSYKVDIRQIVQDLSQWLPYYMIPSFFTQMERLPMMSNGKVDKKVLMEYADAPINEEGMIKPRNWIEEELSDIWKNILKIESISIDQNFFLAKGDSLKAAKLVNHIQKKFQISMSLNLIFTYITIWQQAEYIQQRITKEKRVMK